jgi:hypothetical protein
MFVLFIFAKLSVEMGVLEAGYEEKEERQGVVMKD